MLNNIAEAAKPIQIGRWTSSWISGGLHLDFDGIPLIKGGNVQVFSGDYGRGYYGSGSNPPSIQMETLSDGGRAYTSLYSYVGEGQTFSATQRVDIHPDNSAEFSLISHWSSAEPAILEWNPARLWAYPFLGGTVETRHDGVLSEKRFIPQQSLSGKYPRNRLLPAGKETLLQIPSLGEFEILSEDATDWPELLDSRRDVYLRNDKLFWLGYAGTEMRAGVAASRHFTIRIKPASSPPNLKTGEHSIPETLATKTVAVRNLMSPLQNAVTSTGHPIIIPQPKHASFSEDGFELTGNIPLTISLPGDAEGVRASRAVEAFTNELRQKTGVNWQPQSGKWDGRGLLVTTISAHPILPQPLTPTLSRQAEGYALIVSPKFTAIVGHDAAGAFYGLQTLRQLLRVEKGRYSFAGADITDWPSLKFRGAHIFVGKNALPFHKKLIERIFSRYKMNAIVIECEYAKWKSHPEIHVPYGMDPEDLRQEVDFARDHFLEPIPLINSLGHSEWIFKNGQHIDIAEDIASPHAYDASNPNTYKFIFDVFSEAIDIFHPRYFHIGHDEVRVPSYDKFGKYPARPGNIAKGATALFLEDTTKLSDWLRQRGAKTILWGDMLLNSKEGDPAGWDTLTAANAPSIQDAEQRRGGIPRDAIIADWRYEPGSEQRNGLAIFHSLGHDTLACPWLEPENIRGWARQAIKHGSLGTLQTTWAGYDSNEGLLEEEYKQFSAYLLAAEYAWSGTELHPKTSLGERNSSGSDLAAMFLPYDAPDIFARAFSGEFLSGSSRPGWYLSLRNVCNIKLGSESGGISAYPNFVSDHNGETIDIALSDQRLHSNNGIDARVIGVHAGGIMLDGLLNPKTLERDGNPVTMHYPDAVSLPVNQRAAALDFLHAALFGVENGAVTAEYTICYENGSQLQIHLRYGREIRALDDDAAADTPSSSVILWGEAAIPHYLRQFHWVNPYPKVAISQIEFHSRNKFAAPILFGITGLN